MELLTERFEHRATGAATIKDRSTTVDAGPATGLTPVEVLTLMMASKTTGRLRLRSRSRRKRSPSVSAWK